MRSDSNDDPSNVGDVFAMVALVSVVGALIDAFLDGDSVGDNRSE